MGNEQNNRYEDQCLADELVLAELKGFHNIEKMLIGSPNGAFKGFVCGRTPIPAWRRDWNAAGALLVEHNVIGWLGHTAAGDGIKISAPMRAIEMKVLYADHPNNEAAMRAAIVAAVTEKLKHELNHAHKEIGAPARRPMRP